MKQQNIKFLFALFMSMTNIVAFAYDAEVNGMYYNFSGTEATVTYYSIGDNRNVLAYYGNVAIPETVTYNGTTYTVTGIGNYAFNRCTGMTGITIPNSVTSIGIQVFTYCNRLTSITIPNSVTSIGERAVSSCSG